MSLFNTNVNVIEKRLAAICLMLILQAFEAKVAYIGNETGLGFVQKNFANKLSAYYLSHMIIFPVRYERETFFFFTDKGSLD